MSLREKAEHPRGEPLRDLSMPLVTVTQWVIGRLQKSVPRAYLYTYRADERRRVLEHELHLQQGEKRDQCSLWSGAAGCFELSSSLARAEPACRCECVCTKLNCSWSTHTL